MSDERSGTFLAGIALAVGLVLASAIGGWSFVKGKRGDQSITVTGSARERIKSDLVIWRCGVSYQAPVLSDAYHSLSESVPRVKALPDWKRHLRKPDHHILDLFADTPQQKQRRRRISRD